MVICKDNNAIIQKDYFKFKNQRDLVNLAIS